MKRSKNRICHLQYLLACAIALATVPVILVPKGDLELWTNQFHHVALDIFFRHLTHLGDAILYLWLIPLLSLKRLSFALFFLTSALLQAIVVQVGKRCIFRGMPRPAEFLQQVDFHEVPGLSLHHWHTFPSGHTATAISLATGLMILFPKNQGLKVALLLTAMLVAFSRVYLMQHFYVDVLAGAAVGLLCTWTAREISLLYFSKKHFRKGLLPNKSSKTRIQKIKRRKQAKQAAA